MTLTGAEPQKPQTEEAPTLRADMDAALIRYARTRDPRLRAALIVHHQPLVRFVAARFRDAREPLEDLVQVGTLGLIKAVDGYSPERGVKFSAYALPTILGEIKRHFRDRTWHVKVPRRLQERAAAARKAEQELGARLGRPATVGEVASALALSEDEALEALGLHDAARVVSLDGRLDVYGGGEAATLADVIGRIDAALHDVDAHTDLRRAVDRLEARGAAVIGCAFSRICPKRRSRGGCICPRCRCRAWSGGPWSACGACWASDPCRANPHRPQRPSGSGQVQQRADGVSNA